MADKVSLTSSDFHTRALEIASDLSSIGNLDHGGKQGEDWTRARAAYIRELYEILTRPSGDGTRRD
ncbi:hypothetical protein HNQ07_001298 [Deinococcus metalli]|jgi:hypothetical protein|uniref:Uncharacterized protein n=1 Tax=Deinococcus metalli TaxID=1141878 RepID=A0A7W8KF28_9DEIO|nr:hypothetical protein [Deinococcus metalli]MBB5375841.1 hypothetical protein [Deinococcus metalli]GHF36645.1 hypothetical protein GCM10017781_11620 [Deinococcus metalli]